MKRFARLLYLLIVLALALAGCAPTATAPAAQPAAATQAPEPAAAPAVDAALVMVTNMDDVVSLDPHHAYETTNLMIHNSTYDTLVEYKAGDLTKVVAAPGRKMGRLARRPDLYLHSAPGVKFTSGNPVTAEDVRFSWMRLKNLKGNPCVLCRPRHDVQAVDDDDRQGDADRTFARIPEHRRRAGHEHHGQQAGQGEGRHRRRRRGQDRQGQGLAGSELGRQRAVHPDQVETQGRNRAGGQPELLARQAQAGQGHHQARGRSRRRSCKCSSAATPTWVDGLDPDLVDRPRRTPT